MAAATTKITLSNKEQDLIINSDWILTKRLIIEKIINLFTTVAHTTQEFVDLNNTNLPEVIKKTKPRISKGENYIGLPYVILDYPAYFSKKEVLAIRTFFWWGNFISVQLHVSGNYKEKIAPNLLEKFTYFQQNDYSICISENQWDHHFEETNFISCKKIDQSIFITTIQNKNFIKLAKKYSLNDWENLPTHLIEVQKELITQTME